MKEISILAIVLISLASSPGVVAAQDNKTLINKLSDLSFNQMTTSYFCRKLIGDAPYRTAKDDAVRNGVAAGLPKDRIAASVADADKRIKNLKKQLPASVTADDCRSSLKDNDAQIRSTLVALNKQGKD